MLLESQVPLFKKLNPSGAPLLPNLLRYQALAVWYTAARLLPCIFGKRGAYQVLGEKISSDKTQAN